MEILTFVKRHKAKNIVFRGITLAKKFEVLSLRYKDQKVLKSQIIHKLFTRSLLFIHKALLQNSLQQYHPMGNKHRLLHLSQLWLTITKKNKNTFYRSENRPHQHHIHHLKRYIRLLISWLVSARSLLVWFSNLKMKSLFLRLEKLIHLECHNLQSKIKMKINTYNSQLWKPLLLFILVLQGLLVLALQIHRMCSNLKRK